jgi:hypothetical protein
MTSHDVRLRSPSADDRITDGTTSQRDTDNPLVSPSGAAISFRNACGGTSFASGSVPNEWAPTPEVVVETSHSRIPARVVFRRIRNAQGWSGLHAILRYPALWLGRLRR